MNLVNIQQALFSAYDIRNAMSSADRRKPTEGWDGESVGQCLDDVIAFLESLETEEEQKAEEYSQIFDTNHGELSNPSTKQD